LSALQVFWLNSAYLPPNDFDAIVLIDLAALMKYHHKRAKIGIMLTSL